MSIQLINSGSNLNDGTGDSLRVGAGKINENFLEIEQLIATSVVVSDHTALTNIGTNTHPQIDAHIDDESIHFTSGSIVITTSQISDYAPTTIPAGTISGSSQISITESQITDLTHYTDADTLAYMNSKAVVSGSVLTSLPSGVVSGSSQISITESQITDLTHYTDADALAYMNSLSVVSGSVVSSYTDLTNIPSGIVSSSFVAYKNVNNNFTSPQTITNSGSAVLTVSGSNGELFKVTDDVANILLEVDDENGQAVFTVTKTGVVSGSVFIGDGSQLTGIAASSLPSGVISGSSQVSITESQITDLTHYTDTDTLTYINSIGVVSGSVVSSYTDLTNIPSGIISSSLQVSITESQITDLSHTVIPTGTVSGSSQITIGDTVGLLSGSRIIGDIQASSVEYTNVLNKPTLISSSLQVSITESQITDLTHYTDTDALAYINSIGVVSGSVITSLPSGTVSGSSQITITESQISDLSHTDISHLNTFSGSIQTQVNGLSAATSSYLTSLPAGTISGSSQVSITQSQITDLDHYTDADNLLYLNSKGVVSGSVVTSLPAGTISGSSQVSITESQITDLKTYQVTSEKGQANGYASLDSGGLVPSTQLPSYVDDVLEYANLASFPATGVTGKIYVAIDTNKTYRWSGSVYVYITSGAVDSVAGKTGIVTLDKGDVGLSNVDNTSDANKPVSTATQTALDGKVDDGQVLTNVPAGALFTDTIYTPPAGLVSGSSQLTGSYDTRYALSGSGGVTDYNNLSNIPVGIVSGSSQVVSILSSLNTYTGSNDTLNTAQNSRLTSLETATGSLATTYETRGSGIVSSSAQITPLLPTGTVSGSSQISFTTITNKPTLVSGSSQVSYTGLSSIPAGIVSSSFVAYKNVNNNFTAGQTIIQSGSNVLTVSGSQGTLFNVSDTSSSNRLTILDAFDGHIFTVDATGSVSASRYIGDGSQLTGLAAATLPSGVVSGSSQITYSGISSIPSGIVSSSFVAYKNVNNNFTAAQQIYSSGSTVFTVSGSVGDLMKVDDTNTGTRVRLNNAGGSSIFTIGDTGIVSASAYQGDGSQLTGIGEFTLPAGIVSGSAQIVPLLPSGVISGSISYTNLDASLKATSSLAGTEVDWNAGIQFEKVLSANTTFTFTKYEVGKTITMKISGNYTSTFPTGVDATELTDYDGTKTNWIQIYCGSKSTPVFLSSLRAR